MPKNMPSRDYRTQGLVLRRTNYGEVDRILNIITPEGKISAIAKGARKEKSKLAGGIEMFSLIDLNIHQGKSEFAIITGAKMIEYYGEILKDFRKIELAGMMLKQVNKIAEGTECGGCFLILRQSLEELNLGTDPDLIWSWFLLNLAKTAGEEVNLYRDTTGEKLQAEKRYEWDVYESAFLENVRGGFGADEIKMLRLMMTADLKIVKKVKIHEGFLAEILRLARMVAKI